MFRVGIKSVVGRLFASRPVLRLSLDVSRGLFVRYNSTKVGIETASPSSSISDSLVSFNEQAAADSLAVSHLDSTLIGYLESIGLAQGWGPTAIVERLVEAAHVYTGLPWWGSIVVVTVAVRVILFPLYMSALTNAARMSKAKPQLDAAMAEMRSAESLQDQFVAMRNRKKIMKDNNISTFKLLAPVAQLPIAYGFFQAMRKMASHDVDGFSSGGYSWFLDLTQVDPYLGLHLVSAAVVFAVIKLGGEMGASGPTANPLMRKVLLVLPFASIVITRNFAAAVMVYFAANSVLSFVQTMLLRSKLFRRAFKMPPMAKPVPADPSQPSLGAMDTFRSMMKDGGDKATKKSRDAATRLEGIHTRKLGAQHEFIKRHDTPSKK